MTVKMDSDQRPSRDNHYVPEWYQRGFRMQGSDCWLLDIGPTQMRPDGTPITPRPRHRPPKACFWESDLYITRFGDQLNDEVETVLFKGIDDFGACAVRAFLSQDSGQVHNHYQAMLAYLGAQKLRTPKGLDWIRSRYPSLSQAELMREMQHLRQMFGALWAEAAHEIVSAKDSAVKFIVSDHPVTTFNAALPAGSLPLSYPNDAPVNWNGTQTLFALDSDHLLILTHVDYAKGPEDVPMTALRVNSRHFGSAILRTDALIRTRKLDAQGVNAVNAVLKSRARRYIAAAQPEWLYPEHEAPMPQDCLAKLLLPPSDQLWRIGGEVYTGYADGTFGYRDSYGRTSQEHEFVEKKPPSPPLLAEDPCPCGQGASYARCCESLPLWDRPPWNVMSIQERNQAFLRAIVGILDLTESNSWRRTQRSITDDQVARLHRVSQLLWPENTNVASLLPRRNDGRARAVYMGPSDPRTVGESIACLAPLFDQILVMDPMLISRNLKPEFSPIESPGRYKQQFLKNIWFWLLLEPLIAAGKVMIFPDPGDVSPDFHLSMRGMAQERAASFTFDPSDLSELHWLAENDAERSLLQMPDDALLSTFERANPGLHADQYREILRVFRQQGEQDPLALLQVFEPGESSTQYLFMRCVNLEIGLFVAQSVGAVIATDVNSLWKQLHTHTRTCQFEAHDPAADRNSVETSLFLDSYDAIQLAATDGAECARAALRRLRNASEASDPLAGTAPLEEWIARLGALKTCDLEPDLPRPRATVHLTASMPTEGFQSSSVQRLVVGFGREDAPAFLGIAIFFRTRCDS